MSKEPCIFETLEFRIVLVDPRSNGLLALDTANDSRLPRVRICRWLRPAQQLQKEIYAVWGMRVMILSVVMADSGITGLVVAEPLMPVASSAFKSIEAAQLPHSELSEREYADLVLLLKRETKDPFARIGWIDDAIRWVEFETGKRLASRNEIEQYNAGGEYALVRFPMTSGRKYWLKATGEPNRHEPAVTTFLSDHGGDFVPKVIASRQEWNAVLLSGEANVAGEIPEDPRQALELLGDAVESMANLQVRTQDHDLDLLKAGVFDQRINTILKRTPDLFEYFDEVMSSQASAAVPRLERTQIKSIHTSFQKICERIQPLGIPDTIVHGDINPGNIVVGCGHCQFIDWSEAYLGNCLVPLHHLLLLNRHKDSDVREFMKSVLKRRYLKVWGAVGNVAAFEEGFAYMPLLSAVSNLYGRGDWLNTPARSAPRRQSYARTLILYMDDALRALDLQATFKKDGSRRPVRIL